MTSPNRPLFWIASQTKRKISARPAPAFGVRSAVGRPAKAMSGHAPAGMNGTRSTQEEYVPPAFTNRLQVSASRAVDGRRTPIGMRSDLMMAAWYSSVRFRQEVFGRA